MLFGWVMLLAVGEILGRICLTPVAGAVVGWAKISCSRLFEGEYGPVAGVWRIGSVE
jgi:hypothetical protein